VTQSFADHFSGVAEAYASFRPQYPQALFAYLAGLTTGRDLAWDCAAGSGQATMSLLPFFDRIIATDASKAQLSAARAHPKVTYHVALAEDSGIADGSVNLVTVAQAAHWLDLERFYAEVRRVLVPEGIIAMWAYGLHRIGDGEIDRAINFFYKHVVGAYWPTERALIEAGYRTISFPFDEASPPGFEMVAHWTLPQLLGYLRTWSAVDRYRTAKGIDPVVALESEIAPWWGDEQRRRRVTWPLALRVGSVRR
jgi:SAM-dependent methyltransferase